MCDAALKFKEFARPVDLDLPTEFIVATIHRAENTDDQKRLKSIISALAEISRNVPIVLPLHPRTRRRIIETGICLPDTIIAIEPVSYLVMLYLLKYCRLVMTDSGGMQKEAYFFEKPCITLRNDTEWVELVEIGVNVLAGADRNMIIERWKTFTQSRFNFTAKLYGQGDAGQKIVSHLSKFSTRIN